MAKCAQKEPAHRFASMGGLIVSEHEETLGLTHWQYT
jgi:hypothetical protein